MISNRHDLCEDELGSGICEILREGAVQFEKLAKLITNVSEVDLKIKIVKLAREAIIWKGEDGFELAPQKARELTNAIMDSPRLIERDIVEFLLVHPGATAGMIAHELNKLPLEIAHRLRMMERMGATYHMDSRPRFRYFLRSKFVFLLGATGWGGK